MNKKSLSIFISLFFLLCCKAFSQIKLLSPIEGVWSNKQMLVLDTDSDGYFVYSVDGTDPETFGFAYDGPVLLDVTGDVDLKIIHISSDGTKETANVQYSVTPFAASYSDYGDFVSLFYETGVLNYSAGSEISIPSNLVYSLGLPPDAFIQGQSISLAANSVLSRYIPCTIWDRSNNRKWRFIIKTYPQTAGIYSKKDFPFQIENWKTIVFADRNKIYKIDDELWDLPLEDLELDRSVAHTIYWQDLNYEVGNPIESVELPPVPELSKQVNEDGSVVFKIDGDSAYKLSVLSFDEKQYEELFDEIGADVFFGDKSSGNIKIGVFANSVYQGEFEGSYNIDKRPPDVPAITTNASSFYSRNRVNVQIQAAEDCDLYVALSEPYFLKDFNSLYTQDSEILKNIPVGDFRKVKTNSFKLSWQPKSEVCVYYKIQTYCKNGKNVSQIGEYSVIIDQFNYYVNESARSDYEDGTAQHPFTSFEKCLELMNKSRSVCLRISGPVTIKGNNSLLCNTQIINNGDGSLIFAPESSLILKGTTLEIQNSKILSDNTELSATITPLFKLENAVFTLKNCQVSANFLKNGNFCDAYSSILNVGNSIISINASSYVSFLSSVKSRITVKESMINTSADTSVVFSSTEGNLNAVNCSFKVTGKNGRIAELFGVKASFENNKFNASLKNAAPNLIPLYKDSQTKLKEVNNEQLGF